MFFPCSLGTGLWVASALKALIIQTLPTSLFSTTNPIVLQGQKPLVTVRTGGWTRQHISEVCHTPVLSNLGLLANLITFHIFMKVPHLRIFFGVQKTHISLFLMPHYEEKIETQSKCKLKSEQSKEYELCHLIKILFEDLLCIFWCFFNILGMEALQCYSANWMLSSSHSDTI